MPRGRAWYSTRVKPLNHPFAGRVGRAEPRPVRRRLTESGSRAITKHKVIQVAIGWDDDHLS